MDGMYPPTSPPSSKKRLRRAGQLANGEPVPAEGEFVLPQAVDYGPGGYNASPAFVPPGAEAGYPPTEPPVPMEPVDPFASPVFNAYNKVVKRGMPGQPPKQDPLMDPLAGSDGTQPTRNVQLSVEGPKVTYDGTGPTGQSKNPMYGGRLGRRMSSVSQPRRRR